MKMETFVPAIPELVKSLGASKEDAHRAAVAITTTDLVSKEAALQVGTHLLLGGGVMVASWVLSQLWLELRL
jgi:glutamate N-acetyltransferase/amino-acid N-acetyltransferase